MNTKNYPPLDQLDLHELNNKHGLKILIHRDGTVAAFRHESTLINRLIVNPGDCSLTRIYLRQPGQPPINLLAGNFAADNNSAQWSGKKDGLAWRAHLLLASEENAWFWCIHLHNESSVNVKCDIVYGQDVGLADLAAARNNESYVSHYIDHLITQHPQYGHVVLSRQNQEQGGGRFPWLAQGCWPSAIAYSTDATQFFGQQTRLGEEISALTASALPSRRLQQEYAYTGLQTQFLTLPANGKNHAGFFALFQADHPAASSNTDLASIDQLKFPGSTPSVAPPTATLAMQPTLFQIPEMFNGDQPGAQQLAEWFPGTHQHLEKDANGKVLSFFHGLDKHVATRAKEEINERPHGHILRSGEAWWPEQRQMGATIYASGIFGAQIYVGNVNLARLTGVARCTNNILRSYGRRIFVETPLGWRQLAVPSAFEMAPHYARWIYANGENLLEVLAWCPAKTEIYSLHIKVLKGPARRFIISDQLVCGDNELDHGVKVTINSNNTVCVIPAKDSLPGTYYPGMHFEILFPEDSVEEIGGSELLDSQIVKTPWLACRSKAVKEFYIITAALWPEDDITETRQRWRGISAQHPFTENSETPVDWTGNIGISSANSSDSVLAQALPWLAHNAMIHFSAPHGLEQFGGAAWGLRDVCQGPTEWLLAGRRYPVVRRILETVFSQQYPDDPLWPQWFMHRPFSFIQHPHSHGDIPFWPVKALVDYIEASNDFSILDCELPYTDINGFKTTSHRETVLQHVEHVIDHYERHCIGDTAIISYGDGDWDDTLQPANSALRAKMTSPWTMSLAFHAFYQLADICRRTGSRHLQLRLENLLERMQEDFRKHLMPDGIICGFAHWNGREFEPLFHPYDKETGIAYRLLPMNRAILSGLLTPRETQLHLELIRKYMLYPDGVRLMSSPLPYHGGVMTRFKRAESAAYFGREVSLQYVHEHIRYCEVMAKVGDAQALIDNLLKTIPVGLESRLFNAAPRQSNAYFSSSDGDFADRLQAAVNFDKLRSGEIQVKGGWRIYSSGPGLLFNTIVCKLFGIRESFGDVVIDPVLTEHFTNTRLNLTWNDKKLEFHFKNKHADGDPVTINGLPAPVRPGKTGKYRREGLAITRLDFEKLLHPDENIIVTPI